MGWSGVKKQANRQNIEDYSINSQGEIDVEGNVSLGYKDFEGLLYKFGTVTGYFDVGDNQNLTSLKNCPNKVGFYFRCSYCPKLESLEGCPKVVGDCFYCSDCKGKFTEEKVCKLCKALRVYNKTFNIS